jgi:hypothetical protein
VNDVHISIYLIDNRDLGYKKNMDDFPLIISFYTKQTLYQLEIQNLLESCAKWGLPIEIEGIESLGSWELNCAYKPFFIYRKLQELKRPLLWVDADAIFLKKPEPIEVFKADFSVRINESLAEDHPSKVISSTIFANYTQGCQALLRAWVKRSHHLLMQEGRREEFWDQIALRDAIFEESHTAHVLPMPLSYTKISDHPVDCKLVLDPVIEHYQASRRFKKTIHVAF